MVNANAEGEVRSIVLVSANSCTTAVIVGLLNGIKLSFPLSQFLSLLIASR